MRVFLAAFLFLCLFFRSLKEEILGATDEKEEDQEDQHGSFPMDLNL